MSEIIRINEPMEFDAGEVTEVRFNWYGSEDLCQMVYVIGDEEEASVIAVIADEYEDLKADRARLIWLLIEGNYCKHITNPASPNCGKWISGNARAVLSHGFRETANAAIDDAMKE